MFENLYINAQRHADFSNFRNFYELQKFRIELQQATNTCFLFSTCSVQSSSIFKLTWLLFTVIHNIVATHWLHISIKEKFFNELFGIDRGTVTYPRLLDKILRITVNRERICYAHFLNLHRIFWETNGSVFLLCVT